MNKPSLNSLVTAEAKALVANASNGELSKLSLDDLRASRRDRCIYGQMTGDCFSDRAINLIELCANRVYNVIPDSFTISGTLNGTPKGKQRYKYWSPIEIFIAMPINQSNGNNKMLIDFLTGKRKTLKFK